jgi:hypothetical protein
MKKTKVSISKDKMTVTIAVPCKSYEDATKHCYGLKLERGQELGKIIDLIREQKFSRFEMNILVDLIDLV